MCGTLLSQARYVLCFIIKPTNKVVLSVACSSFQLVTLFLKIPLCENLNVLTFMQMANFVNHFSLIFFI